MIDEVIWYVIESKTEPSWPPYVRSHIYVQYDMNDLTEKATGPMKLREAEAVAKLMR